MAEGVARIGAAFEAARAEGRAALMPYMMGCFPDPATSIAVAEAYAEGGADLVELGVPFSDPLADGPVIHAAATRALDGGATLDETLEACSALGEGIPAVTMCYVNMVLALGPRRFAARLAAAGAAGAIVPDLPFEESAEARAALDAEGLALVPLVAPTTPPERRRAICDKARGFVYAVSDVGVTGERSRLPAELEAFVAAACEESPVPVAVGFGIGSADQAAAVGRIADGVIVGSRLVRAVSEAPDPESATTAVREYLGACLAAMAS